MLGVNEHMDPKLFGREIIFEEFQRIWIRYLIITDRRTDRRLTVASPRSALASCGKTEMLNVTHWHNKFGFPREIVRCAILAVFFILSHVHAACSMVHLSSNPRSTSSSYTITLAQTTSSNVQIVFFHFESNRILDYYSKFRIESNSFCRSHK